MLLRWHGGELLQMTAHRYATYLQLYHPNVHKKFAALDLSTRAGAVAFWRDILPSSVTNMNGGKEDPIAYLLRHTQLLPRQLLAYLNCICVKSYAATKDPCCLSANAVVEGIAETEETVCIEILSAYK